MPNRFRFYGALSADATIPDPALVCLIGPAGSGKSTLARRWAETQLLELDRFRAMVSDDFSVKFSVLSSGDVRPLTERSGGPSTDENE
ncbi:AAA family ATPase [Streptomyces luridiscabiei]|uniref:AAA family ATPase n=1 Tax=Streptomyces luridiscabiei TaxID=164114 RepID=UPI0006E3ECD0|nr:AAA family ATPase [Streptomyces luridiscabiei]